MGINRLWRMSSTLTGLGGIMYASAVIKETQRCITSDCPLSASKQKLYSTVEILKPNVFAMGRRDPEAPQVGAEIVQKYEDFKDKTGIMSSRHNALGDVLNGFVNENFIAFINTTNGTPVFAYECLTQASVNDDNRCEKNIVLPDGRFKQFKIKYGTDVPRPPYDSVYGQLASEISHKGEVRNTFKNSNNVPMRIPLYDGMWFTLQNFTRDLADKYDAVHVLSGPLYFSPITEAHIPVPDFLFKVVVIEHQAKFHMLSFLVPNQQDEASNQDLNVQHYEPVLSWCAATPSLLENLSSLNFQTDLKPCVTRGLDLPGWLDLPIIQNRGWPATRRADESEVHYLEHFFLPDV